MISKRKIKYLNVAEGSEWSKTKAFWAFYNSAYNCAKEKYIYKKQMNEGHQKATRKSY